MDMIPMDKMPVGGRTFRHKEHLIWRKDETDARGAAGFYRWDHGSQTWDAMEGPEDADRMEGIARGYDQGFAEAKMLIVRLLHGMNMAGTVISAVEEVMPPVPGGAPQPEEAGA